MMLEIVERVWLETGSAAHFSSHNANLVVNGDAELVAWCDNFTVGCQACELQAKMRSMLMTSAKPLSALPKAAKQPSIEDTVSDTDSCFLTGKVSTGRIRSDRLINDTR